MILKFAIQLIEACELLEGTKYGSDGATITEFTNGVGGGKLNVDQTPALANAAAIVERNVVMGTVGIV
ncbi:hypothetical protein UFOVP1648_7 [uncultured Caudovirales phage]|uniref:Uncharacterized protein n=1 Tax=uncultured Caudovirales phage TaxID=2100421 RepID=A0A6J5T2X8_9CAUD|nr:hypothetical protein UFOVP1648_7 [uncultured Caudovirales phage]